jgi:hypothetical protein
MTNFRHRYLLPFLSVVTLLAATQPAHAVGVDPAEATLVQREQAQSLFKKGRILFQRERYDEAIVQFRASHDIVASPNTRLLIARCLRESGKLVEAYVEFGRTAIEAEELEQGDPRYARAARAGAAERKALEPELGFVSITIVNAGPESVLHVADEKIKRVAWNEPIPVMPGDVHISIESPGYLPANETVVVKAGHPIEVTIDARANPVRGAHEDSSPDAKVDASASTQGRNLRPYAYVAGGIGVAGLATFTIAGLMARSSFNDLEESCQGSCPPDRQDDIDSGRSKQTIANVGLVIGVVGLAAGTTLYFMSDDEPDGTRAGLVVSPGWIGVKGRM